MAYNKVDGVECSRCKIEIGWINYLDQYRVAVESARFRCLRCYELEWLETKQQQEDNKKPLPFPENAERIRKINERKIELIDDTIKQLQAQKENIKQGK